MKRKIAIRSVLSLVSFSLVGALLLCGCGTGDTASGSPTSSSSSVTPSAATASSDSTSTASSESASTASSESISTASSESISTATADSTVTDNNTDESYDLTTTYSGSLTSFTARSDEYSIGYYISDGQVVSSNSLFAESDEEVSSLDLDLTSSGTGFTAVYATGEDTTLDLTGKITVNDTSDGQYASDFTGLGSQIVATDYAQVNVDEINIYTIGFLRDAFIADEHAQITVNNSTITTMGANPLTQAYSGYENSAIQSTMISPPWVLGIQGGVRSANMLGNNATLSVIDSQITSGSWAVLSTDAGSNFVLNVIDSALTILPESEGGMSSGNFSYSSQYGSGYGSYLIGNATENFYGTTITGTTYGAILTGGTATYQSSNGSITLENADGETVGTYTGKNEVSSIDSVFGFMSHNSGVINVLDGTQVNAQDAVFLYKAGDVTFNVDNASLTSNSGVILQMIDNDDSTVGAQNGDGGPVFNTTFSEEAGWPSENGSVSSAGGQSNTVNLNLANGSYTGNVYNGTGYYDQSGDALNVNLGEGATLQGVISLSETRHVDENGEQNTSFTIEQYYYLGHVANRAYNNQSSKLAVTLSNGATWTVTDTSYLTSLTIDDGTVQATDGKQVVMTVDGVETPIVSGTYTGNIVISVG
jgi:hypothetical protein